MNTFEITFVISVLTILLAMAAVLGMLIKDNKDFARRIEVIRDGLGNMATEVASQRQFVAGIAERLDDLQAKMDQVPVEEMDEEIKRMASWNDGWDEIVNFGKDIPKLNKEGLKHE